MSSVVISGGIMTLGAVLSLLSKEEAHALSVLPVWLDTQEPQTSHLCTLALVVLRLLMRCAHLKTAGL